MKPDEVTRLRDCVNELIRLIALPALWTGGEPPHAVGTLLQRVLGIAKELDERVAEQTQVLDSIPGLVALLTPEGGVEFVNRQILDYTGRTLEELRQWGTDDTVHPEDLPDVIEAFTQSITSGRPYEIVQRLRRSDGVYRWFQNKGFRFATRAGMSCAAACC